jgi:hypothetical protein
VVRCDNVVSRIAGCMGRSGRTTGQPEERDRGGSADATAIRVAISDLALLFMLGFP